MMAGGMWLFLSSLRLGFFFLTLRHIVIFYRLFLFAIITI